MIVCISHMFIRHHWKNTSVFCGILFFMPGLLHKLKFILLWGARVYNPEGFQCSFSNRVSHLSPRLERGSLLGSEMPGIGAFAHNEHCKIVHSRKFSADLPHTQHSNQRTALEDKSYTDKWFFPLCCAACCTEQWLHWTIHRISFTFSKIQPHPRRYHMGALSSSALQLALSVHLGSKSCKENRLVSQGCFPWKMNPKAPFFKHIT